MKSIQKLIKSPILLLLSVLMLLSAGCGSAPAGPVKLTIWHPFLESEQMQDVIGAYQQQHPNVQIEFVKKDITTYEADLVNALASGEGPDIYVINNSWVNKYKDKIQPAPDNLYTMKEYKDAFIDALYNDFVINNKIYGAAMWVDSLGFFYNKDLMGTAGIATPPKTWSELEQDVRQITKQDSSGYFTRSGIAMGTVKNVNRPSDILYLLMLQAGATPWSTDGQYPQFANSITKNGEQFNPGVEALKFYTSFADPNSENYNWNQASDYSIDAFANGRAAFMISYPYAHDLIRAKAPNLNYDVAKVPQYSLQEASVNYANYFSFVVGKQTKSPKTAWDFIKFVTGKDTLEKFYATNKHPSSRRDLIEKQTTDLDLGVFASANLTAKTFFKPDEKKFDDLLNTAIESVLYQAKSPEGALSEAQNQAELLTQVRN